MRTLELAHVNFLSPLNAALYYASLGFPVFPLKANGKTPLCQWRGEATTNPQVIHRWFTRWPDANIGVPLGNGWFALDLDLKGQGNGWQSYMMLGGPYNPPWPRQYTPNGGLHLLVYDPEIAKDLSNFSKQGPRGGVDMRCDGGYIAVAPSRLHQRFYRWADGDPLSPLPQSFGEALRGFSHRHAARLPEDFPIPTPSPLTDTEIQERLLALGNPFWAFLRQGDTWTGDASRDAYASALRAFSVGWTLEDMARIGPQTTLATFGAESPHNAPDPWRWCWRYTIREAYELLKAQEKKKAPEISEPVEDENSTKFKPDTNEGDVSPTAVTAYQLLRARVSQLDPQEDVTQSVEEIIREAVLARLPQDQLLELLYQIKKLGGSTLEILKAKVRRIKEETQVREPLVLEALQDVFIEDQNKVLDRRTLKLLNREAWAVRRTREFDGDRTAAEQVYLTGRESRMPTVSHLTYDPRLDHGVVEDHDGVPVFNRYRGSGAKPVAYGGKHEIRPWLDLLDALQIEGPPIAREWLLDHAAWWVQRPGEKLNHGLLMGGEHGIGKDSWLAPVLDAVGRHNVTLCEGSDLLGGFSHYLADCKVLVINEVNLADHRDRHQVAEHLKGILASPPNTLPVNEKNIRPYEIPNLVQAAMFTNHRHCMQISPGERRYFAAWCNLRIPATEQDAWERWFEGYWTWLEGGGSEAIGAYLQQRPIETIRSRGHRPPVTPWLEDLMDFGRDPLEVWLIEQIDRAEGCFKTGLVKIEDLLGAIQNGVGNHLLGNGMITPQRLGRALFAVGAKKLTKGSRRERCWLLPGAEYSPELLEETKKQATVVRIEDRKRKRDVSYGIYSSKA